MAKFFAIETDRAFVTLNSATVQAVSEPSCIGCSNIVKGVADNKANKIRQVSPAVTVDAVVANPTPGTGRQQVDVLATSKKVAFVDADGKTVSSTGNEKRTVRVLLDWEDAGWRVAATALVNL